MGRHTSKTFATNRRLNVAATAWLEVRPIRRAAGLVSATSRASTERDWATSVLRDVFCERLHSASDVHAQFSISTLNQAPKLGGQSVIGEEPGHSASWRESVIRERISKALAPAAPPRSASPETDPSAPRCRVRSLAPSVSWRQADIHPACSVERAGYSAERGPPKPSLRRVSGSHPHAKTIDSNKDQRMTS
jgi:hypothetical protein